MIEIFIKFIVSIRIIGSSAIMIVFKSLCKSLISICSSMRLTLYSLISFSHTNSYNIINNYYCYFSCNLTPNSAFITNISNINV